MFTCKNPSPLLNLLPTLNTVPPSVQSCRCLLLEILQLLLALSYLLTIYIKCVILWLMNKPHVTVTVCNMFLQFMFLFFLIIVCLFVYSCWSFMQYFCAVLNNRLSIKQLTMYIYCVILWLTCMN